MAEIVIIEHQARWRGEFEHLGGRLRDVLGDTAIRIDHIGSTAVPGLAAKDIVDIQVTVSRFDDDRIRRGMELLPAVERLRGPADHQPPGESIPPREREKWLWHVRTPHRAANVHVRLEGRWNQRYALLCRDFLRAHPRTAAAYGEVKRQLARLFPDDAESYYDVKDPAFDLFMSLAGEWAERTDWEPGPSDA